MAVLRDMTGLRQWVMTSNEPTTSPADLVDQAHRDVAATTDSYGGPVSDEELAAVYLAVQRPTDDDVEAPNT